ncbi:MAG: hypothetical protein AAFX44_05185 [Pseudomonadota bacterium]
MITQQDSIGEIAESNVVVDRQPALGANQSAAPQNDDVPSQSQPNILARVPSAEIDQAALARWSEGKPIKRFVVIRPNASALREATRDAQIASSMSQRSTLNLQLLNDEPIKIELSQGIDFDYGLVQGTVGLLGMVSGDPASTFQMSINYEDTVSATIVSDTTGPIRIQKLDGTLDHVMWEMLDIEVTH